MAASLVFTSSAQEERLRNSAALLSQEEENWAMMAFLLIDEGTIWVHKLLADHIKENEGNVHEFEFFHNRRKALEQAWKGSNAKRKGSTASIRTNKVPKLLNDDQFRSIFPPADPASVNTKEFDLTLLITVIGILRVRPEPTCKWNVSGYPDETFDHEHPAIRDATNLVRMRFMRNTLYAHIVECKLPQNTFDEYWPKLQKILESFGADLSEVTAEKLKKATENREDYVNRITTLFTADVRDAEEFAQRKMNEIAENHKPSEEKPAITSGFKMYMEYADGTRHEM